MPYSCACSRKQEAASSDEADGAFAHARGAEESERTNMAHLIGLGDEGRAHAVVVELVRDRLHHQVRFLSLAQDEQRHSVTFLGWGRGER